MPLSAGEEIGEAASKTLFYSRVLRQLERRPDRELAVLGGAVCEDSLKALLGDHFSHVEAKERDRLFRGPLRTAHTCRQMAYAFRVISEPLRTELALIADIRNDFAHRLEVDTFETVHTKAASLRALEPVFDPCVWGVNASYPAQQVDPTTVRRPMGFIIRAGGTMPFFTPPPQETGTARARFINSIYVTNFILAGLRLRALTVA